MHEHLEVVAQFRTRLLGLANVVGVGVCLKEKRGVTTGDKAIAILVRRKLPQSQLKRSQVAPGSLRGKATDVVEVGELRLLTNAGAGLESGPASRMIRQRPAHPGVSIGHFRVSAGTFGALVTDKRNGGPLILSNNHVLANITDGYDGRGAAGDPVLQPGAYDGGTMEDVIGYVERYAPLRRLGAGSRCAFLRAVEGTANLVVNRFGFNLRLEKTTGSYNKVDAAVARPISDQLVSSAILGLGDVMGVEEARLGMKVVKSGRTSGVTSGTVRVLGATVEVSLGDAGTAMFEDQILTSNMGQPGDSGSLVLSRENRAVGLLCAGSDTTTVCNHIRNVMDALQIGI